MSNAPSMFNRDSDASPHRGAIQTLLSLLPWHRPTATQPDRHYVRSDASSVRMMKPLHEDAMRTPKMTRQPRRQTLHLLPDVDLRLGSDDDEEDVDPRESVEFVTDFAFEQMDQQEPVHAIPEQSGIRVVPYNRFRAR